MSLVGIAASIERNKVKNSFDPLSLGLGRNEAYRGIDPIHGFLEIISRPGWIARSILAGDMEAATKHAFQFVADLPFGWIDKKLSGTRLADYAFELAGSDLLPDNVYDLTTRKEKYEFSDVLQARGAMGLPSRGSWGRFGIDLAGGILTDPTMLIGGPAKGLAKGALGAAPSKVGREMLQESLETGLTKRSSLLDTFSASTDAEMLDNIMIHALKESGVDFKRYVDPGQPLRGGEVVLGDRAVRSRAAGEARKIEKEFGELGKLTDIEVGGQKITSPKYEGEYFWESLHADDILKAQSWLRENGHIDTPGGITWGMPFTDAYDRKIPGTEKALRYLRNILTFGGGMEKGLSERMGTLGRKIGSLWDRSNGYDSRIISEGAKLLSKEIGGRVRLLDSQARDMAGFVFGEAKEIDEVLRIQGLLGDPNNFWRNSNDVQRTALNQFQDVISKRVAPTDSELTKSIELLARGQQYRSTPRFSRAIRPYLIASGKFSDKEAIEAVANLKTYLYKSLKKGGDIEHTKFKVTRDGVKTFIPDSGHLKVISPFRLSNNVGGRGRDALTEITGILQNRGIPFDLNDQAIVSQLMNKNLSLQEVQTLFTLFRKYSSQRRGVDLSHVLDGMTLRGGSQLRSRGSTYATVKNVFQRESLKYIETDFPSSFIGREIYHQLGGSTGQGLPGTWANGAPLDSFFRKQHPSKPITANDITSDLSDQIYSKYYKFLHSMWEDTLDYAKNFDPIDGRKISSIKPLAGEASMALPEIMHKRILDDNRRRGVNEAFPYIEAMGKGINEASPEALKDFFRTMIGEVNFDRGIWRKLLAGGVIHSVRLAEGAPQEKFLLAAGAKTASYETKLMGAVRRYTRISEDGALYHDYHFGGVNKLYKPLLTSDPLNLSYHVGNAIGSGFMLATDPRIGWQGFRAVLDFLPALLGLSKNSKTWQHTMDALGADPIKSIHAVQQLKALNFPMERLEEYRRFLGGGHSLSMADLMNDTANTAQIFHGTLINRLSSVSSATEIPAELYSSWRKLGEKWANTVESHLRVWAYDKFRKAGMSPTRAADKVQSLLVNYTVQSPLDQILRDWFPFIRFSLASGAWTKAVLLRPKPLVPVATSQRASGEFDIIGDPDKTAMSELSIGLPGGVSIPTRAGAEATLKNIGMLATPLRLLADRGPTASAFKPLRSQLSQAHPLASLAAEGATGVEFWSGKEFGSDTRVPPGLGNILRVLPSLDPLGIGLVSKGVSRWGQEREEIDPKINKLLDSLPISRHLNTLSKVVRSGAKGEFGWSLAQWSGLKDKQQDALQEAKHRLRALINDHIEKGTIYEFQKVLSARRPEDTSPEVKMILDHYTATLRELRERGSLDKMSRGN